MQKTVFIRVKTIYRHLRTTGLHRASSTTLPNTNLNARDHLTINAIMGQNMQFLSIRVQFKNTGALSGRKMDSLRCDHLQDFIQI